MIYNRLLSAGVKAFIDAADAIGKTLTIITEYSAPIQSNRNAKAGEFSKVYRSGYWTKEYTDTELILTGVSGTVIRVKYVDIHTLTVDHYTYAPRVRQWFVSNEYVHECALAFGKVPGGFAEFTALTGVELSTELCTAIPGYLDGFVEEVIQRTLTNSLKCLTTSIDIAVLQLLGSHRLAKILPMAYPVDNKELPGAVILGVVISDPTSNLTYNATDVSFKLIDGGSLTVPIGYVGLLGLDDGDSYVYRAVTINGVPLIVKAIMELNEKEVTERRSAFKLVK